jgi:enoyl-CoA hydratase/carnithine racemase
MEYETVKVSKENKVATIEINRPDVLNAFNTQLILDLQQATKFVKDDNDIRVVIISGSGRAFSSGADLKML